MEGLEWLYNTISDVIKGITLGRVKLGKIS